MDRSDGISQFCLSVYSELTGQNKSMIAMIIIWRIWCSRNQLIWVEKINLLGVATSFKGLDLSGLSDSMALTDPPP